MVAIIRKNDLIIAGKGIGFINQEKGLIMDEKTLDITDSKGAHDNISDLKTFGNPDLWKLLCKASSQKEGWMKTTKIMDIGNDRSLIQTETQQRNPDGSYALSQAVVECVIRRKLNNG